MRSRFAHSNATTNITEDGGVVKTILKPGEGESIPDGSTAVVHYVGTFEDGRKFDSSRDRNKPFKFQLGKRNVILGWDKAVATMRKGELCVITCQPLYAYGKHGIGPIPGDSVLVFEIELLDWHMGSKDGDSQGNFLYLLLVLIATTVILFMVFNNMYPKISRS